MYIIYLYISALYIYIYVGQIYIDILYRYIFSISISGADRVISRFDALKVFFTPPPADIYLSIYIYIKRGVTRAVTERVSLGWMGDILVIVPFPVAL